MRNPHFAYLCCITFSRFWCIFHILEFFGIFWQISGIFFSKISEILSFQRTSRIRNLAYLWKAPFKWVKYTILSSNIKTTAYFTAYFPIFGSIFAYIFRRVLVHAFFPFVHYQLRRCTVGSFVNGSTGFPALS